MKVKIFLFGVLFLALFSSIIVPSDSNRKKGGLLGWISAPFSKKKLVQKESEQVVQVERKERENKERARVFEEGRECPICIESFDNTTCYVAKCGHSYHKNCAIDLLDCPRFDNLGRLLAANCSICRKDLDEEERHEIRAIGIKEAIKLNRSIQEREDVYKKRLAASAAELEAAKKAHAESVAEREGRLQQQRERIGNLEEGAQDRIFMARDIIPFYAGLISFSPYYDTRGVTTLAGAMAASEAVLSVDLKAPTRQKAMTFSKSLCRSLLWYGLGCGIGYGLLKAFVSSSSQES